MPDHKILIVEDELVFADDVRYTLQAAGYEVLGIAISGEEAISSAREKQPDLILMDIGLRGAMDGVTAAALIHTELDIPIVFLTAYTEDAILERARQSGSFGYLSKPFSSGEMRSTIEMALSMHETNKKLRQSEALLRQAQTLAHIGSWQRDFRSGEGFWSDEHYRILGYQPGEVPNSYPLFLQHIHPEDRPHIQKAIEEAMASGQSYSHKFRIIRKDGEVRYVQTIGHFARWDGKNPPLASGTLQDITERVLAEQALRESEARYRAVVEDLTDMILRWKPDYTITFANPAACRALGLTQEQILNLHIGELPNLLPEDQPKMEQHNAALALLTPEKPLAPLLLIRAFRPNGQIAWEQWQDRAIFDEEGRLVEFQAVGRDITELVKAEQALQESEKRYRSLFEHSPLPIWEEDFSEVADEMKRLRAAGIQDFRQYFDEHPQQVIQMASLVKVVDCNQKAVETLEGKYKHEVIKPLPTFFTAEMMHSLKEELISLAEGKTHFENLINVRTIRGNVKAMQIYCQVAPGFEESLSRVLVTFTDLTYLKQTEDALKRSQARLNEAQRIAHIGSWERDLSSGEEFWSDEHFRLLGYEPGEVRPSEALYLAHVHPEDRERLQERINCLMEHGGEYQIDLRLIRKDGTIRRMRETGRVVSGEGMPQRFAGTLQDMTDYLTPGPTTTTEKRTSL